MWMAFPLCTLFTTKIKVVAYEQLRDYSRGRRGQADEIRQAQNPFSRAGKAHASLGDHGAEKRGHRRHLRRQGIQKGMCGGVSGGA